MRSSQENLKPRPLCDDQVIKGGQWGKAEVLDFPVKTKCSRLIKRLFIIWLFASVLQAHNRPVGITGE